MKTILFICYLVALAVFVSGMYNAPVNNGDDLWEDTTDFVD